MGKRGTILSCVASFGFFALGATVGARRTRRRLRHAANNLNSSCTSPETLSPHELPPSLPVIPACDSLPDNPRPDPLECPVCLGDLILPRVTTCGHTLCTTCLAALFEFERRPSCPICRKRIKVAIDKLPINFMVKACIDARVAAKGEGAWSNYRQAENEARELIPLPGSDGSARRRQDVIASLRPAWNWFKWSIIIVTEFGAFLVSLKEVLESTPARSRRYQRIV